MAPALMAHPELRNPYKKAALAEVDNGATILFNNTVTVVQRVLKEPGLWVLPEDLTRINGFVLKPEGACLGDLCVPVKQDSELLKTVGDERWFCVSAFAALMEQALVVDEQTSTWSFGEFPVQRQALLTDAQAPDFEVLDRQGKVVRMADFKGKKALIVTWSSW